MTTLTEIINSLPPRRRKHVEARAAALTAQEMSSCQLHAVHSEAENDRYTAALYDLEQHQDTWGTAEKELADLLTLLIEDFEERNYRLPKASPPAVLQFLMEQHGLKKEDLAGIFGTSSLVSEVLSGKHELNKDHIRGLSARFHVSPEFFF